MKKATKTATNEKSDVKEVKKEQSVFEKLNSVNLNDHIEKRKDLTYISWVYAWAEAKKLYSDITYRVHRYGDNQLPYVYDENTGYMVSTEIKIQGLTHTMWLPVLDSANKSMKNKPYKYQGKYGMRTVEQASMFDINKAIMRCLVKNLAMFGLGLYIYAGEDLPLETEEKITNDETKEIVLKAQLLEEIQKYGDNAPKIRERILSAYKIKELHNLTIPQIAEVIRQLQSKTPKQDTK